jgi:hypothetical protein
LRSVDRLYEVKLPSRAAMKKETSLRATPIIGLWRITSLPESFVTSNCGMRGRAWPMLSLPPRPSRIMLAALSGLIPTALRTFSAVPILRPNEKGIARA